MSRIKHCGGLPVSMSAVARPSLCCSLRCWACAQIDLEPNETLFRIGEDSESGMFIVVSGSVGVYLQVTDILLGFMIYVALVSERSAP